jgi:DNA mismatch repair ATPase MutS
MTDVDFTRAAFGYTGLSFKTLSVIIEESNTSQIDEVIFLYRLVDGMARESHGYYIAEKAGVSEKIVVRATSRSTGSPSQVSSTVRFTE